MSFSVRIVDSDGDPMEGRKVWAGLSPLIPQTPSILEETRGGERTARYSAPIELGDPGGGSLQRS
jgi:hypothetical protein